MSNKEKENLISLCSKGDFDSALKLLSEGWDPMSAYGPKNETPMHYACAYGNLDFVKVLIDVFAADPYEQTVRSSEAPIHWACRHGNLDIVKYIAEKDGTLGIPDHYALRPLHVASQSTNLDLVKFLVEEQQQDPKRTNSDGQTALHFACASQTPSLDIVRYLVDKMNCNPRKRDYFGRTLLHQICSLNRPGAIEILKYLVDEKRCDPNCEDGTGKTPLQWACKAGAKDIIDYLTDEKQCNPYTQDSKGYTPLHSACESDNVKIVTYLINEKKWNPNFKNAQGHTPLHLLCRRSKCNSAYIDAIKAVADKLDISQKDNMGVTPIQLTNQPSILQELFKADPATFFKVHSDDFQRYASKEPPQSPVSIFVVGNPKAGKSTLVESLQCEGIGLKVLVRRLKQAPEMTAGIVPYEFVSKKYGTVTLYDLAGQKEFYGSHAAVIQSVTSSTCPIFIVVVDLSDTADEIKRTLLYWITFLDNQCTSPTTPKPHVIVLGSHADTLKSQNLNPITKLSQIVNSMSDTHSFASMQLAGQFTADCRKNESMKDIRQCLKTSCDTLRNRGELDEVSHCLLVSLTIECSNTLAITLDDALQRLRKSKIFSLPRWLSFCEDGALSQIMSSIFLKSLTHLHNHGHLILFKNKEEPGKSWLILDKEGLLSRVWGTIFAPIGFKEHAQFATRTGVVPLSKLEKCFSHFNTEMVVCFLSYLEFCHEINDREVKASIPGHNNIKGEEQQERYFLFPALITTEKPDKVWGEDPRFIYQCGWMLQCSRPEQFFITRFLQVLLLRLIFSYALVPDCPESEEEMSLHRRCKMWKNGIFWANRDGVETLVEVSGQNQMVYCLIRCLKGSEIECVRLRSALIQKILNSVKEFCPKLTTIESFIHPSDATHPLKSPSNLKCFSIQEIARATTQGKTAVINDNQDLSTLEELLCFDSYCGIDPSVINELFDAENPYAHEEVSDRFLYRIATCIHERMDYYVKMFKPPPDMLQNLIDQAPPGTTHATARVFQIWRLRSEGSYQCLLSDLNQFSVFAGRNPQDI